MPRRKMDTTVIREVLRLRFSLNLSIREISRSVDRGKSNIQRLIPKAGEAGLSWPVPEDMDDEALERLLYGEAAETRGGRIVPKWAHNTQGTEAFGGDETAALGGIRGEISA